jgi:hypothetical protein
MSATVTYDVIHTSTSQLAVGQTEIVHLNNPGNRVWGFTVVPVDAIPVTLEHPPLSFRIKDVRYAIVAPGQHQIQVTVENTGSAAWGYNMYGSSIVI